MTNIIFKAKVDGKLADFDRFGKYIDEEGYVEGYYVNNHGEHYIVGGIQDMAEHGIVANFWLPILEDTLTMNGSKVN